MKKEIVAELRKIASIKQLFESLKRITNEELEKPFVLFSIKTRKFVFFIIEGKVALCDDIDQAFLFKENKHLGFLNKVEGLTMPGDKFIKVYVSRITKAEENNE